MRVAVVGSRAFRNFDLLCSVLDHHCVTEVISGGAMGADTLAEAYANQRNLPKLIFPAEWNKYGKAAGYRRNIDIVKNSDKIVAFWDGESKGTWHTITLAKKFKKPYHIIFYKNFEEGSR